MKTASWYQIASILEQVIQSFEANHSHSSCYSFPPTHFDSMQVPGISVKDYLERINNYSECSDSCFVLAFIYIDRILQANPGFVVTKRNIHRLILSAVTLAIKYSDDLYASNATYAKIGGISLEELNLLEAYTLMLLCYNLYVDAELYFQYAQELELRLLNKKEKMLID